jgi:hypothetical protein
MSSQVDLLNDLLQSQQQKQQQQEHTTSLPPWECILAVHYAGISHGVEWNSLQ